MQFFQGKSVSQGIAMGPVVIWYKKNLITERKLIVDVPEELMRMNKALELSKEQLRALLGKVRAEEALDTIADCKETGSAVLEAHLMLLTDDGLVGQIQEMIQTESVNAEYAVWQISEKIAELFAGMEDEYMRERAADIQDIATRLLQNLRGEEDSVPKLSKPSIILAEDLSPGETLQFDRDKVLAFATVKGSCNSHVAILARSMGIPALVGVSPEAISSCRFAIVDARVSCLICDPDSATIQEYKMKLQEEQERKALLQTYKNQESVTLDGVKISICANVGNAVEVQDALNNGADGIGLFRSEFLYVGKESYPSEEEQFEEYKRALVTMGEKPVVIRTLDIGADKQADYFGLEPEENPALGCRGVRICLKRPDIFKVQLRALLRAAVYGNPAMMYPMIISAEEVEQIQGLLEQVTKELEQEGIPYRIPIQGIMIETPAAVMISDELARKVDFFSIGTNDLTQYTLAVDRQNARLDEFYNPHHPAILKMIQMTVDNAHKAGKWVGICGELAGDTTLTKEFVRMGVDELSVVPGKVPEIRKVVREMKVYE